MGELLSVMDLYIMLYRGIPVILQKKGGVEKLSVDDYIKRNNQTQREKHCMISFI